MQRKLPVESGQAKDRTGHERSLSGRSASDRKTLEADLELVLNHRPGNTDLALGQRGSERQQRDEKQNSDA